MTSPRGCPKNCFSPIGATCASAMKIPYINLLSPRAPSCARLQLFKSSDTSHAPRQRTLMQSIHRSNLFTGDVPPTGLSYRMGGTREAGRLGGLKSSCGFASRSLVKTLFVCIALPGLRFPPMRGHLTPQRLGAMRRKREVTQTDEVQQIFKRRIFCAILNRRRRSIWWTASPDFHWSAVTAAGVSAKPHSIFLMNGKRPSSKSQGRP